MNVCATRVCFSPSRSNFNGLTEVRNRFRKIAQGLSGTASSEIGDSKARRKLKCKVVGFDGSFELSTVRPFVSQFDIRCGAGFERLSRKTVRKDDEETYKR